MNTWARIQSCLVGGLLGLACVTPLHSATIFDNSVNDLITRLNPGTYEVGDQVKMDPGAPERFLTQFDFEYWGANGASTTFAGAVQARVRFYQNNGTPFNGYATPNATPFWDSGWFGGFGTTDGTGGAYRATLVFTEAGGDFPYGGLIVPDEFTWTVQFSGMGGTDTVGVDIYSPPVTGADYPDYWQNDGTGWILLTNTVPMDFAARMYATVPEPSSLALSLLGGLGILAFARRFRHS